MFAEAELLSATFLPLLELRTQLAPLERVPRLEFLSREGVLLAGHGSHDAHRATHDHARNGSPPARGASLMETGHAEARFERIVGAGQALDIVALKEIRREVVGDVTEMRDAFPEWSQLSLLLLHLLHKCQVALAHLCPGMLRLIGQDLCCLTHQMGGAL